MIFKNAFLLSALFALPVIGFSQSTRYDSLVWSDEFNYNLGGGIDPNRWFHQTQLPNGSSWYNGEIQHYTNQDTNANVKNGKLFLRAVKESYTNQGVTKNYTSARLNSKFAFKYGRVEVKAKLPTGAGTWPAIWMLGKNISEPGAYWQTQGFGTTPWPDCGEIDIMEHWGANVNHVSSALHTPSSFGATQNYSGVYLPTATSSFHTYTMEWSSDSISFFIDNNRHYTYSPSSKNASTWPFDDEQYILLNFAVLPSIYSAFTQAAMEIDYVRVYQERNVANLSNAQVTFSVDLNQYANSFTAAYINGDFNNWCGTCNPLSDTDNDGIWTTTLPISQSTIEYKFTLDGWNASENFSPGGTCTNTSGSFTNRYLQILGDTILNPVCWESCINCPPLHTVTFAVNTANITVGSNGLYAGGGILGNARALKLEDPDGDKVYTGNALLNGHSQGKFIFLNNPAYDTDWGTKEDLTGKPCADVNNWNDRTLPIFNSDTTLLFCFETCATDGNCPSQQGSDNITFSVDMNSFGGSFNNVYINGNFNGWCGSCNPMDDSDGDGIWTVTLPFTQGSIEYLFTLDGWTHQESFVAGSPCTFTTGPYTNRMLSINGSAVLPTVCWNSCSGCITTPQNNNYSVTFRVNTANITVGPNGIYAGGGVLGGANAVSLSDPDGDGIWEGTATVNGATGGNFVFFNSPSYSTDWGTKEVLTGLPCADPSHYDDRILPTFNQDTTLLFCFGSCETDGTCPTPATPNNVTFAVDMNQYGGSTANGVFINGDFNGWCGNCNPMDDSDGDGVWTVTLPLTQDSIEYKFTVDGWNDQENFSPGGTCTKTGSFTNRFLAISGDTTLATVCWNSCSSCAPTLPAGVTLDANGCIECDSLNVGDFFVLNGDTMEVVDKPRLLAIVAAQGDLSKVCVSHITDMKNALRGYTTNNYDISHWDVSNVTNMNSMFFKNRQFNQDISSWNTSNVTNTIGMFTRCDSFNQDLNTWDMSQVTNMNRMFKEATSFNGAIANWDVENVVRMAEMFSGATSFNQDLSDWCVRAFQYNPPINFALNATAFLPVHYPRWGNCPQDFDNVTSLATGAFVNANGCVDCSALNIGDYFELNGDTLLVVDRGMLDSLILLHDDLSKVCVSNITDMKDALRGLRWFNTDIAYWDVSNVTDMSNMFFKAQIFNQDIGNWDVSSVTRMSAMFQVARVFDQDISAWDVSNVQRFRSMFRNAAAFNQNIGPWDVGNVLNDAQMSSMFRGCASFNQDLSMWCVSNVSAKPTGFNANSALVSANLPAWGTCPTAGTMISKNNPIASNEANGDNAADQVETQEITLFPNPTTGMVKINPVVQGSYKILDAMGKTLEKGTAKEYYNFSKQTNGIYTLMLQTENNTHYLKVVKQ